MRKILVLKFLAGFKARRFSGRSSRIAVTLFGEPSLTFEPFNLPAFGLLNFFDGDTDDLYSRCVDITRVTLWNGHKHIQAFHDLTKDRVLAV